MSLQTPGLFLPLCLVHHLSLHKQLVISCVKTRRAFWIVGSCELNKSLECPVALNSLEYTSGRYERHFVFHSGSSSGIQTQEATPQQSPVMQKVSVQISILRYNIDAHVGVSLMRSILQVHRKILHLGVFLTLFKSTEWCSVVFLLRSSALPRVLTYW